MGFSTYGDLKLALASWLNRSDLTDAIPDFIKQAEATLNKVLRTRYMIESANVTIAADSDRVGVPADLIDVAYVVNAAATSETLIKQVPEWMARSQRLRLRNKGTPLYYSIIGADMVVCPVPASGRTYKLSYYREIPALSDGSPSNWLLSHHPDLYLYTALMHAYPFLADEARSSVMGNQMVQMVQALLKMNETTTLEGTAFDVNKG